MIHPLVFYSGGFGLIFFVLWLLYRHALHRADEMGLDDVERYLTKTSMLECLVYVGFGTVSALIAILGLGSQLAGMLYFGIGPTMGALGFVRGSRTEKLLAARRSA